MKSSYAPALQAELPLLGGLVQAQRLVVPHEVIRRLPTWRHACRLAWKLKRTRITQRTFAELTGCYPPHVSAYFSQHEDRRQLPAEKAGVACAVLGNLVLVQWLAWQCQVTVLEEFQAQRSAA